MRSHHGQSGVNRLLTRLAVEFHANGWTIASLCREAGVHRSVLDRWLDGRVANPLVNPLVAFVEAMGMRVDIVAPHHQPLLHLDEFETAALVEAARAGWQELSFGQPGERHLRSALRKLGKLTTEANEHV